ncbi:hypothetical protein CC78DRAFT_529847 [Lojkania enalia]|uniref:Uncharacterized protein n=1 Tax=Lojkania enalia TaxID=147567 RepID=A0A9P4KGM6_9PLEO|nr:hypothetical protein CC78DRAFT_529847 [Didymosphaeria enalia]
MSLVTSALDASYGPAGTLLAQQTARLVSCPGSMVVVLLEDLAWLQNDSQSIPSAPRLPTYHGLADGAVTSHRLRPRPRILDGVGCASIGLLPEPETALLGRREGWRPAVLPAGHSPLQAEHLNNLPLPGQSTLRSVVNGRGHVRPGTYRLVPSAFVICSAVRRT